MKRPRWNGNDPPAQMKRRRLLICDRSQFNFLLVLQRHKFLLYLSLVKRLGLFWRCERHHSVSRPPENNQDNDESSINFSNVLERSLIALPRRDIVAKLQSKIRKCIYLICNKLLTPFFFIVLLIVEVSHHIYSSIGSKQ